MWHERPKVRVNTTKSLNAFAPRNLGVARNSRIAIIGGGVSGITAAYALMKRGYRVSLFETATRIGGKVESVQVDGQTIELGAYFAMHDNKSLIRMAKEVGVLRLLPSWHRFQIVVQKSDGSRASFPLESYWGNYSTLDLIRGHVAFIWALHRPAFRKLFRPGFYALHPDLTSLTMIEFANKYGFSSILEPFYNVGYACGYGAVKEHAALYSFKMMQFMERVKRRRFLSFGLHPGLSMYEGGFQVLWEGIISRLVSDGLTLRLGSQVTAVERKNLPDGHVQISITCKETVDNFDALIVATPPEQTLEYLDATVEERDLFKKVHNFDFHTIVFRARGLNENDWISLRYNMSRDRYGRVFTFYGGRTGSGLFTGYYLSEGQIAPEEVDRNLADDLRSLGGTLESVVLRRSWRYFPHVKLTEISEGYYAKLNSLQGKRNTFFLGALFAFETTEHCAEFAEYLVDKHF
jgi:hypothetical protein